MLIALYERVVRVSTRRSSVSTLITSPGVEAGKEAAGAVIALKLKLVAALNAAPDAQFTAEQLAAEVGAPDSAELAFKILERLAANKGGAREEARQTPWFKSTYRAA